MENLESSTGKGVKGSFEVAPEVKNEMDALNELLNKKQPYIDKGEEAPLEMDQAISDSVTFLKTYQLSVLQPLINDLQASIDFINSDNEKKGIDPLEDKDLQAKITQMEKWRQLNEEIDKVLERTHEIHRIRRETSKEVIDVIEPI